jgi:hypothetical protein
MQLMAGMVLPIIEKHEYRAFRKILRQYVPPRYDAWKIESEKHLRALNLSKVVTATQVVTADGFASWLQARRVPADLSQLNAYAWELSQGAA